MDKNKLIIGAVVLAVLLGGAYVLWGGGAWTVLAKDTVYNAGDNIPDKIMLTGGALLTVNGDYILTGGLSCDGGPLKLVVNGDLTVKGTMVCKGEGADSIMIVATGDVTFAKSADVKSDGSVQVVNDESKLLTTDEAIEAAYQEAGQATGTGPRIGPFIEDGTVSVSGGGQTRSFAAPVLVFAHVAHADDGAGNEAMDKEGNVIPSVVIGGDWIIGEGGEPPPGVAVDTPQKKIKRIIINFNFGQGGNVNLKDFHLVGPAGRDGKSDEGKNCTAKGENGENAMRFRVVAKNIEINNFRIELGNGGAGGTAETTRDCDPGIAKGGNGGEAGNMKMTAKGGITVNSMTIVPGMGGNGGGATAYGKDGTPGCPGKKGGDATATGGDGGKNKKELSATGAVSGIGNITIGAVVGGFGGSAFAYPGKGGDGTGCNCNGGPGGKATASGGKGGDASVEAGGAVAADGATGGNGGDAQSVGGNGGNGGQCPLKSKGGDGGKGGDATSKEGTGGTGDPTNGDPGTVKGEKGGDGGNGGDGCGPGAGGAGGKGREPGAEGKPGALKCPEGKKPDTGVVPSPGTGTTPTSGGSGTPTPTGGGTTGGTSGSTGGGENTGGTAGHQPIPVIRYQGKYLPVEQLIVEDEAGCGAEHWHAAQGVVIATDGSQVFDPGPQCGFGPVSQNPVMQYTPQ